MGDARNSSELVPDAVTRTPFDAIQTGATKPNSQLAVQSRFDSARIVSRLAQGLRKHCQAMKATSRVCEGLRVARADGLRRVVDSAHTG